MKIRFEKLSNFWQSDKIFTSEITRIFWRICCFVILSVRCVPTLFSYRLIKKWFALQDHPVFTVITGAFKIGFENIKNDQKEENKISQSGSLPSLVVVLSDRDYCYATQWFWPWHWHDDLLGDQKWVSRQLMLPWYENRYQISSQFTAAAAVASIYKTSYLRSPCGERVTS